METENLNSKEFSEYGLLSKIKNIPLNKRNFNR